MLRVFVGYDERESIAYHTFVQSLIDHSSGPLSITPLKISQVYQKSNIDRRDGSNDFIYTRFLVPYLCEFKGLALFFDGDMVIQDDPYKLVSLHQADSAVSVVKHNYKTKYHTKYLGNKNEDYPRKNWSSVMLFNCEAYSNRVLTPEFIAKKDGSFLHRLQWLKDNEIGELPPEWNWLAIEYSINKLAKNIHYTLGTPCFNDYKKCEMSEYWWESYSRVLTGIDS
jgi:lipopolysaccharide biosynthesis glycosyltransferase